VVLIYSNFKLYYTPKITELPNGKYVNEDVYSQLQHLKHEIQKNEAAKKMQSIFPEGAMFLYVLYGLSWCNAIEGLDESLEVKQEGVKEIKWILEEISKEEVKETFNRSQSIENGVFYSGWSNYLTGRFLEVSNNKNSKIIEGYKEKSNEIYNSINGSETPYLETYPRSCWPADMFTCIVSLKIHDNLYEENYTETINTWLQKVSQLLDEKTGLIPHSVDCNDGSPIEGARGSSQSLMMTLLYEIDKNFFNNYYEKYKQQFLAYRLGLPGIREYPKGQKGRGDIDSGPVILGVGGAASIVGQQVFGKKGDFDVYEGLRNSIELFGMGSRSQNEKKYIFGELPIADAFICWSNSIENKGKIFKSNKKWRWQYQLISVFGIMLLSYLLLKI